MVAHRDGLGALEMGVAGHHGIRVFPGLHDQGPLQAAHLFQDFINLRAAVEARIRSHLVITGAGRVQLGAGRADAAGQLALNVHVHVLQLPAPGKVSFFNVFQDVFEAGFDGVELFPVEQSCLELRPGVGNGPGNVLAEEPPVVGDGFAVALNQISGGFRKSAFPHDPHVVPQELPF